ncbi:FtsH protease activity modulator HflK [Caulobacter radicis]|uniref:FtsH protease activity modulator HflK n=1 Tax=Caulobacter radicis TaxID=2172650 RepID=UPI000D57E97D|nr:FtsH protease activity modulator HflK [Caulobacter radicis]PVM89376.1 FtsH protease activity modulator HflK [Caulobacter radicis]
MPWNDNAGPGPWGSPPPGDDKNDGGRNKSDPGRRPASGPPGVPPPPIDVSELVERVTERLRATFGGPGRGKAIMLGAGAVVGLWLLTGTYVVQPNQQGVVTTFGAYSRTSNPGLRYHLPWPFEAVQRVPVTSIQTLDIGGVPGAEVPAERLMLTGDENIVDLSFTVQWRVSDAGKYVFNVREPNVVLKDVAESAMREVVGKTALTPILTNGRGEVEAQTRLLMQRVLDRYDIGVYVEGVRIQVANAPEPVVDAFRDVQRAAQNAQSAANVARGEAAQVIQQAKGYREQVVREASGDAARFNQVYDQYKLAPAVTRERLYIETMQRVLANSNKVIVDNKGANAPVILPSDTFRARPVAPAAAAAPAATDGVAR